MKRRTIKIIDESRTSNILGMISVLWCWPIGLMMSIACWWSIFDEFDWNSFLGILMGAAFLAGPILFWMSDLDNSQKQIMDGTSITCYDRGGKLISSVDLTKPVYYMDLSGHAGNMVAISNSYIYQDREDDNVVIVSCSLWTLRHQYDTGNWIRLERSTQ